MTKLIALAAMLAVAVTFSSCASKEKPASSSTMSSGSVSYAK